MHWYCRDLLWNCRSLIINAIDPEKELDEVKAKQIIKYIELYIKINNREIESKFENTKFKLWKNSKYSIKTKT